MTFLEACDHLFKVEGFYSNSSLDRGGATKYGITLKSWAAYTRKEVSPKDIMMINELQAKDFYLNVFWNPMKLDLIQNESFRYLIFDQAVNRGPETVIKQIQKILIEEYQKPLKPDGIIGDETLAQINVFAGQGLVLKFLYSCQLSYCRIVQSNPSQLPFLVGWIKRTQGLLSLSLGG